MELHERLSTARPVALFEGRDPFAELKNRVHLAVIGSLGPQLFNVSMDPVALRDRVTADIREHLAEEGALARDEIGRASCRERV